MARRRDVVTISSPSDVICSVPSVLGFVPTESIVVACTHGPRHRLGLTMRFDLDLADQADAVAKMLDLRTRHERAGGVFVLVFTASAPRDDALPYHGLIDRIVSRLQVQVHEAFLVRADSWWSYFCRGTCCDIAAAGNPIDRGSPGASALAAAYALAGQGVLPDREALVRSVAYDGADAGAMSRAIAAASRRLSGQSQAVRRSAVRALVERLSMQVADPRGGVTDEDAAMLAALCEDVIVRDEVLVSAAGPARRTKLLRVLHNVARKVPPPNDAAICAVLAWVSYADGGGAIANVALDRALATDPSYSLALLILDSLDRQVPPAALESVMRAAGRDLRGRTATG